MIGIVFGLAALTEVAADAFIYYLAHSLVTAIADEASDRARSALSDIGGSLFGVISVAKQSTTIDAAKLKNLVDEAMQNSNLVVIKADELAALRRVAVAAETRADLHEALDALKKVQGHKA